MDNNGYISLEQARQALRLIYRNDTESNLRSTLLESFSDELKPIGQKGRYRPSPVLMLSFLLGCTLLGIFLYFSLGGQS